MNRAPTARADASLNRVIWAMAWPAMISMLLNTSIELIDIAMVGRLGGNAVAAVGLAAQCFHVVFTLIMSVGVACVALMARAIGAGEPDRARDAFAGTVLVALSASAIGVVIVWSSPSGILSLLGASTEVINEAVPYFRLLIASSLLVAIAHSYECALRAQRNTRGPLVVAVVMLVSKTCLNALLMFGAFGLPRLELLGAGIATVLTHAIALGCYIAAARLGADRIGVRASPAALLRGLATIRDVLRVAAPSMGERLLMSIAVLVYFAVLNRYGTGTVAAYAIGVRLLSFSWIPGLGFAVAASTLVGQALGAGDMREAKRAGWRSMQLALGVMAVAGVLCITLRGPLSRAFTPDPEVLEQLLLFMTVLAVAQPFMGVHFTLSGALRGAGDTVTPLLGSAAGNWLFRIPLAVLFSHGLGLPVAWVWAALAVDHVVRSIVYLAAFQRGRWAR